MYNVVDIFHDRELSACCIDIKYTRMLYVEHLTYSEVPKVRFSAGSTWYVRRTSVYVYVRKTSTCHYVLICRPITLSWQVHRITSLPFLVIMSHRRAVLA